MNGLQNFVSDFATAVLLELQKDPVVTTAGIHRYISERHVAHDFQHLSAWLDFSNRHQGTAVQFKKFVAKCFPVRALDFLCWHGVPFLSLATLPAALVANKHLVMRRLFDAFFDQLFRESLLIFRGPDRRDIPTIACFAEPAAGVWGGGFKVSRVGIWKTDQFAPGLI